MHVGGGKAVFQLQDFSLRSVQPGFKIKLRQAKCGCIFKWASGYFKPCGSLYLFILYTGKPPLV